MKKLQIALIAIFVFLLVFVSFSISQSQDIKKLKAGMPNTVTLSNGEVIYDLNGEWEVSVEHYGPWAQFGVVSDISEIKQEGTSFVGVTLLGTPRSPKGSEKLRGELDKSGFKKVRVITGVGPIDLNGEILNNGNKMIFDDGTKIKLT
ncbi:MAG: hypothetical protein JSV50_08870 [Desulfobacteraceae bacterium]|nr:MAG: hypothetical protein JSV50_08870 [Desulfobacteraceae bacterium]